MLLLALLGRAHAASVAVVDFQPDGVEYADAVTVSEGVRSALLQAGTLDLLWGDDVADGVAASAESELRAARAHVDEARRLYAMGDWEAAATAAGAAVVEHESAHARVGRRGELADAYYLLGAASMELQNAAAVDGAFARLAELYPGYVAERAPQASAAVRARVADAEDVAVVDRLPRADVAFVRDALRADWVVTGSVDASGEVVARVWGAASEPGDARLVAEVHGEFVPIPAPERSDAYARVARKVVDTVAAAPTARVEPFVREPVEDAPAERERAAAPEGRRRAWVWAGAAALLGAGGLVTWAVWEPAAVPVPGADTWSVQVEGL